jgi:DNA replication licensing factor MCM6
MSDLDFPSSTPAGFHLPPSSAIPDSAHERATTPRRTARTTDALNLDDVPEGTNDTANSRKRRRPRTQPNGDVPLIRDAVGESVAESFETFLKT